MSQKVSPTIVWDNVIFTIFLKSILVQIKLIFARKVVHLASFWKWGFLELESGLLD